MKNSSVKLNNRSDILSVIMARQPVSRKQVSEILGISPAAVTNIVDELISCGLVVEGAFERHPPAAAGGPFSFGSGGCGTRAYRCLSAAKRMDISL